MRLDVAPSALTIAGLDPSGGAGIAADLRGFAAAGVWGAAVCAALTVQSTRGLRSVHPVARKLVCAELDELLGDVPVSAIKTGALGSAANARAIAERLAAREPVPLVVDPVMAPSRSATGARLDGERGERAVRALCAQATLVTPNLDEAGVLLGLGRAVRSGEARDAAVALLETGARAVLVKGGHARGGEAVDWCALAGGRVERFASERVRVGEVHGTGCSLASLIAGRLARERHDPSDRALVAAIRWARARLIASLRESFSIGHGMRVVDVTKRARG
jgi:hydroxymethylpyrimidine/phosphomethylpyrimidine kinase